MSADSELQEPPSKKLKLENEETTNPEIDPLAYTKTGEFTSEVFKIEIRNIHKYTSPAELKKIILKQNLDPVKVKRAPKTDKAFVTFRSEEARTEAFKKLSKVVIKKKQLIVTAAKPNISPFALNASKGDSKIVDNSSVRKKTAPLYKMPYDEQLKVKLKEIQNTFEVFNTAIGKEWVSGSTCSKAKLEIQKILPSPITEGYRNKCEFTVGINAETKDPYTVGFVRGKYSDGNISVEDPFECIDICPVSMMEEVKKFKEFIKSTEYPPYDSIKNIGVWKALEVRVNRIGNVMITIVIDIRQIKDDDKLNIKNKILSFYSKENEKFSVFTKHVGRKEQVNHILGPTAMAEDVCGHSFQIASGSFFQINTEGATVLYDTIRQIADLDKGTILFDICCGTGTIGIILSQHVKYVYGIELVESAVEDAKVNAKSNDIENIEFITGNAKFVTSSLLKRIPKSSTERIVAVLDPPRSGVHADVISCLRNNDMITEIVYVSCDIKQVKENIVNLCRPSSNKYGGYAFEFVDAIAVDLFPHTKKFEVILHFRRDRLPVSDEN